MADTTWLQLIETLAGAGVFGLVAKGSSKLWTKLIDKPLEKSEARIKELDEKLAIVEARADYFERKNLELAGELKMAAVTAQSMRRTMELDAGIRPSLPPAREEMPTIDAMIDLRREAEFAKAHERQRQRDLNPGRADSIDYELGRYVQDVASTPPRAYPPPLEALSPTVPRPKKR